MIAFLVTIPVNTESLSKNIVSTLARSKQTFFIVSNVYIFPPDSFRIVYWSTRHVHWWIILFLLKPDRSCWTNLIRRLAAFLVIWQVQFKNKLHDISCDLLLVRTTSFDICYIFILIKRVNLSIKNLSI